MAEHTETPGRKALPPHLQARFAKKPEGPKFIPSPQQAAFFDWIQNGTGSCVLEAVAGAGKTTTLIRGLRFMAGNVFFGAYNKKISDEIKAKAAEAGVDRNGIFINTVHAAGFFACNKAWNRPEVSDLKVGNLIKAYIQAAPEVDRGTLEVATPFIKKMVSFGKQFLIGCEGKPAVDNLAVWTKLVQHFSADQDLPETVEVAAMLPHVFAIFRQSHDACPRIIDFDDMVYAPIAHRLRLYQNEWVLIDECQDLNPARREMARLMLKPGGRAIFVGDSRQAIYGFTGAGGDAIERIIEEFNAVRLPLTVTYRCPKAVVNYVHQWVSHIEAHPDAPEGVVRAVKNDASGKCTICKGTGLSIRRDAQGVRLACKPCAGTGEGAAMAWFMEDRPGKEDAILCRLTRPLILTAYGMIKEGIACRVEGRDIGNGLVAMTSMWRVRTIERLEARLAVYLAREVEKARAVESDRREQEVTDKVETLRVFMKRCQARGEHSIEELIAEIRSLFADDVSGVTTLSTGHKAKGREWDRVYWLQTQPRMGFGRQAWEMEQEDNVKYVIGTRAKKELILVPTV